MRLRGKLLLAQWPLVAALASVASISALEVSFLGRRPLTILQDNYRSVLACDRMMDALDQIERELADPVFDERAPAAIDGALQLDRARFESELRVEEGNITERGEAAAAQRVRGAWRQSQVAIEAGRRALGQGRRDRTVWVRLESPLGPVKAAVDEVIAINQEAMVRKSNQASQNARRAVQVTAATALVAFLLAWLTTSATLGRLLVPLWLLRRTIARVGEGDLETQLAISGDDELAQLAASVNVMVRQLQELRQRAEGRIVLAEHASQAVIDSLPDPVMVFDRRGATLLANNAARAFLWAGGRRSTYSLEGVELPVRAAIERVRDQVLAGGSPNAPSGFEHAIRARGSIGGDRYFLVRGTGVRSDAERAAGATVTLHDITSLRLAFELRNDLVATVAHEVRTPLTSIRLATHMCLEGAAGPLSEKQGDLLQTAREECERLESMVEQLLDLARVHGGRVELRREAVSAESLVAQAIACYRPLADERRVTLRSVVLPGMAPVIVDRDRIQLVFSNLLSNAIRHSPPHAEVAVLAASGPSNRLLQFEVSDTGPGIPAEFHASVFDRFRQLPGGRPGSLGIGLAIAKDLVEAHGGQIGVENGRTRGSRFWFTLPTQGG